MERDNPIEVSLEAGPGDFRFRLDGVAIHVNIRPSPFCQAVLPAPASQPVPVREALTACAAESQDEAYFRQVTQDLYLSLGKLAKEINLSLQNLSLAEIIGTGLVSPGDQLDQVRTQVNDVLEMTEQATLSILDLVEQIREDCQVVQSRLPGWGQERPGELAAAPGAGPKTEEWTQLLAWGADLDRALRSSEPQENAASGTTLPRFPLGAVLQTVLEFCSNDAVKQHLKPVQAQYATLFNEPEAEAGLSRLASQAAVEDGFYQVPVEDILSILTRCAADKRVQELCVKMAGSAGKIFPLPLLPLEAQPEEAGDGAAPPSGEPPYLGLWEKFYQGLKDLAASAPPPGDDPASAPDSPEAQGVPVPDAQAVMSRINAALLRITEHLSFQDLSGQRLKKVQTTLCQLQVHVLTLLVAAGNKLRTAQNPGAGTLTEAELLAQEELDRLLHGLTSGPAAQVDAPAPPADQPLDQDAVNEILTNMGF